MDEFFLIAPRELTSAERARMDSRRQRLRSTPMAESIEQATTNLSKLSARKPKLTDVRIRRRFIRVPTPESFDYSDRKLPPKELRPPAARIRSPRGAALRFFLTALFEAQTSRSRAGTQPANTRPIKSREELSWVHLLASPAQDADGRTYSRASDKKERQIHSALKALDGEELVALPHRKAGAGKYEEFRLLHESGKSAQGPNEIYLLPKPEERALVDLPIELFTQGWIHCLEDTELGFLLMIASLGLDSQVSIEGAARVHEFGLNRDAYEAHTLLSSFGLLEVRVDPRRHDDGKIQNYQGHEDERLHRFTLVTEGFKQPAHATILTAIDAAVD